MRDFECRWKRWILVAATSEGACLQIRHTVKVVLAFTEVGGFSRRFLTPVSNAGLVRALKGAKLECHWASDGPSFDRYAVQLASLRQPAHPHFGLH